MKYAIGIDIGKKGAVVVIDDKKNILIAPTPITGDEIDIHQITKFLEAFKDNSHCVIEDVHSIFGVGAKANFQFGRALGIIEGVVCSLNIPYTKVSPKKWQSVMWQGIQPIQINTGKLTKEGNIKYKIDTKATSLIAAKRLFPNTNFKPTERSKKDHDGSVDACLMAEYCRRNFS